MIHARLELIRQRRKLLTARAALQRLEVAQYAQAWQQPLALADRGIALIRRVREHPAVLLLGLVTLVFFNRKKPARALYFGGMAWRIAQNWKRKKSDPL